MLSEEALERLNERLAGRIETLNEYMLRKLAEQIVYIGEMTPSQARMIYQSIKYGNDINEIITKIAEITEKNEKDIYEMFEAIAKKNQDFAKVFYEARNIPFIPYEQNEELQRLVYAIAKRTADEYLNIAQTSAMKLQKADGTLVNTPLSRVYQEMTDNAVLAIETGRESYPEVMRKTMSELAKAGIRSNVVYRDGEYTKHYRRLDTALRMNVLEGVRTLENQIAEKFGDEFGANGIEVVHHKNPAPDHSTDDIQNGRWGIDGTQFARIKKIKEQILNGTEKEITGDDIDEANHRVRIKGKWYKDFDYINENLTRPVSTLNCYHFIAPIIVGVSDPIYNEKTLKEDERANREGFYYEGKHYTNYEGTQLQRAMETKIRRRKEQQMAAREMAELDGDLTEAVRYQKLINKYTDEYKELCQISGLPTRIQRLQVDGYRKLSTKGR